MYLDVKFNDKRVLTSTLINFSELSLSLTLRKAATQQKAFLMNQIRFGITVGREFITNRKSLQSVRF